MANKESALNNESYNEDDVSSRMAQERQQNRNAKLQGAAALISSNAKDAAAKMVKDKVKKEVMVWVLSTLAAIFLNPVTWIIILCVLVALVGYWCSSEPVDCIQDLGFGTVFKVLIDVIKAIIG